jgi:hypothetical protein
MTRKTESLALAHSEETTLAHISKDIWDVICLTRRGLPPRQLFVDQLAQLTYPIGAEQGATRTQRDYRIGPVDIGPLQRQRPQTPLPGQIRDAIPTPIVAYREDFKGLSS